MEVEEEKEEKEEAAASFLLKRVFLNREKRVGDRGRCVAVFLGGSCQHGHLLSRVLLSYAGQEVVDTRVGVAGAVVHVKIGAKGGVHEDALLTYQPNPRPEPAIRSTDTYIVLRQ